jgi:hypothetical protein
MAANLEKELRRSLAIKDEELKIKMKELSAALVELESRKETAK